MDQKELLQYWKTAYLAAKIASEGAFQSSEEEFYSLCQSQWQHSQAHQPPADPQASRSQAENTLRDMVRLLLKFFVGISQDAEQEARFGEILAEFKNCQTADDLDEFKISLNILLNFFQKTLREIEEDRAELQSFLSDMSGSIHTLQATGNNFLSLLEDFRNRLETIHDTQKLEVMFGLLVAHCENIRQQGHDLYQSMVESNHRIVRLQQQLDKFRQREYGSQPRQFLDAPVFREKFRHILQTTRLQRNNLCLAVLKLAQMDLVAGQIGRDKVNRIHHHLVSAFCRELRRNDLITRLDLDSIAILLLNDRMETAKPFCEKLLGIVHGLKFRFQEEAIRLKGQFGLVSCQMYDTSETMMRKAILAIDLAQSPPGGRVATENEIPPEYMESIYT